MRRLTDGEKGGGGLEEDERPTARARELTYLERIKGPKAHLNRFDNFRTVEFCFIDWFPTTSKRGRMIIRITPSMFASFVWIFASQSVGLV